MWEGGATTGSACFDNRIFADTKFGVFPIRYPPGFNSATIRVIVSLDESGAKCSMTSDMNTPSKVVLISSKVANTV